MREIDNSASFTKLCVNIMPLKKIPMLFFVYANNTAEVPSSEATAPFTSGARNRLWKNVQFFFWHVLCNDGQLLGLYTIDGR
jgi:hypothetical protein